MIVKTVNTNSVLGVMNLFNNEEYYKYAVEVLWKLREIILKEIKIDYGCGRGIRYDTKHSNFWIAEITNEIIGRTMINDYVRSSLLGGIWYVKEPRSNKSNFLTYNEAKFIADIINDENLMSELYRLRNSVSQYADNTDSPTYNIYKVVNDLIMALTGQKMLVSNISI